MAVGLLEAFELIEVYGKRVLTAEEILFAASARGRCGCKGFSSKLLDAERVKVMEMGKRIKKWKDEHR